LRRLDRQAFHGDLAVEAGQKELGVALERRIKREIKKSEKIQNGQKRAIQTVKAEDKNKRKRQRKANMKKTRGEEAIKKKKKEDDGNEDEKKQAEDNEEEEGGKIEATEKEETQEQNRRTSRTKEPRKRERMQES